MAVYRFRISMEARGCWDAYHVPELIKDESVYAAINAAMGQFNNPALKNPYNWNNVIAPEDADVRVPNRRMQVVYKTPTGTMPLGTVDLKPS